MKKIILSSIAAVGIMTSANAGMVIDVTAGAGMWNAAPSGYVNGGSNGDTNFDLETDAGLEESSNLYYYIDVDHFVPLLPNVRIERQELTMDATKSMNIQFLGKNFNAGDTKTSLDLGQNDLSLYWGVPGLNLLTAGILDVGFGLNLKQFNGSVELSNTNAGTENVDMDFVVPMGYLSATVDPPFIPAKVFASYKTISYKDSSLNDIAAKVMINLPIPLPLIDFTADIGYKEQSLTIDESLSDDINVDIKFSGVTFGISAKF
jgi:outer membrane protein